MHRRGTLLRRPTRWPGWKWKRHRNNKPGHLGTTSWGGTTLSAAVLLCRFIGRDGRWPKLGGFLSSVAGFLINFERQRRQTTMVKLYGRSFLILGLASVS